MTIIACITLGISISTFRYSFPAFIFWGSVMIVTLFLPFSSCFIISPLPAGICPAPHFPAEGKPRNGVLSCGGGQVRWEEGRQSWMWRKWELGGGRVIVAKEKEGIGKVVYCIPSH
jgi:hypothetical protein